MSIHLSDYINKKLKDIGYDSGKGYLTLKFEGNMSLKIGRVGESDFYLIKDVDGILADEKDKERKAGRKARKSANKNKKSKASK